MFGAAAVRKKRKEQQANAEANSPNRGPLIKPFGPRFDPKSLPYFKYKQAIIEAQELKDNVALLKAKRVQKVCSVREAPAMTLTLTQHDVKALAWSNLDIRSNPSCVNNFNAPRPGRCHCFK